ncbi:hypothetical protein EDD86DRAFT_274387 [Gorgonomyces haynaldii]|nr:hypothetical protein EDD86DRAFT_274387 [Gorgonomyces haynaldii]
MGLLKRLEKAVNLLFHDSGFLRVADYDECWHQLLDGLNAPDIVTRYTSLRYVIGLNEHFGRILQNQDTLLSLVKLLLNICASEEKAQMQNLGALGLGYCCEFMNPPFPEALRRLSFGVVTNLFLTYFPSHVAQARAVDPNYFENKPSITIHTVQGRIQLLTAIGLFLDTPEAQSSLFMSYIDALLDFVLSSHASPLLHATALQLLCRLKKTNRNRLRIEQLRPTIKQLSDSVSSASDPDSKKKRASFGHLKRFVNQFWIIWCPLPPDYQILTLPKEQLKGYAERRRNLLMDKQTIDTSQATDMEVKTLIQPHTKLAYKPVKPILDRVQYFSGNLPASEPMQTKDLDQIELAREKMKDTLYKVNLEPPELEFLGKSSIVFYIENLTATQDTPFYIESSHPDAIQATPSCGIIPAGYSTAIEAVFHSTKLTGKSHRVEGHLWFRTGSGWPIERVAVVGYRAPFVHVTLDRLDFGYGCINSPRSCIFTIENLLAVPCPIVLALQTGREFSIEGPIEALEPNETRVVTVEFKSGVEGKFNDALYIAAFGEQIIHLKLNAVASSSLSVLDTKLDFGPTDIFYNSVKKTITMVNHTKDYLPVSTDVSTNEIVINHGQPLVLGPKETKDVQVEFTCALTGGDQEVIRVTAPNASQFQIQTVSTCSPELSIPVHENIYLPPGVSGQTTFTRLPLTNCTGALVTFTITAESMVPVKLDVLNATVVNSKPPKDAIDSKLFSSGTSTGVVITLAGYTTCLLEVGFSCSSTGPFKFPLRAEMVKPRRAVLGTYQFHVMVLDKAIVSDPKQIPAIRDFFNCPWKYLPSSVYAGKIDPSTVVPSSLVLKFKDSAKILYGGHGRRRSTLPNQAMTLVNLTAETQRYRLILSSHFKTSVPLEGDIPGNAALEIPVFLDPKMYMTVEESTFTAMGTMFAIDGDIQTPGITAAQLHGLTGNLAWLQIRQGCESIKMDDAQVMEQKRRTIVIRNKAPVPLEWFGELLPVLSTLSQSNAVPFVMSQSKGTLKPYEHLLLDLGFQSPSPGDFKCKMNLNYSLDKTDRLFSSVLLECTVGKPELTTSANSIFYGDIPLGDAIIRDMVITNDAVNQARLTICAPPGIALAVAKEGTVSQILRSERTSMLLTVPPKSVKRLLIRMRPQQRGVFLGYLSISNMSFAKQMPLLAYSDRFSFDMDQIQLRPFMPDATPSPTQILDFGTVCTGTTSKKRITLRNLGNLPLKVADLDLGAQTSVTWQFPPESSVGKFLEEGEVLDNGPEGDEINWDELSFIKSEGASFVSDADRGAHLRILPKQTQQLTVVVSGKKAETFTHPIELKIETCHAETQNSVFWVKGSLQPAIQMSNRQIKFPVVPIQSKLKQSVKLTNPGTEPTHWRLEHKMTQCTPVHGFTAPKESDADYCPVKVYPKSGVLQPNQSCMVEVEFSPLLAQFHSLSRFVLHSGDFAQTDVTVAGSGASTFFKISETDSDFGVLRVGASKWKKVRLQNVGMQRRKYFVETIGEHFTADPETGILEGGASVDIFVSYSPRVIGNHQSRVHFTTFDDKHNPLTLFFKGMASYPDLVVLTKLVDFQIAMYKSPNYRKIEVENRGHAEASILFKCLHPHIKVNTTTEDALIIGPHTKKEIEIVYTPQIVEKLNARAFIGSTDERGDNFMVTLKGSVGIPRLTVIPENALNELDFGVMRLGKTYERTFKIFNDGTIYLNFEIKIAEVSCCQITNESERKLGIKKPVSNVPSPVIVVPPKGTIGVGEELEILITFTPAMLLEYEYSINVCYDYYKIPGMITGVGGRVLLTNESPLPTIDFGLCRVGKTFKKPVKFKNDGNLGFFFMVRPEPENGDWSIYDNELKELAVLASRPNTQEKQSRDSSNADWISWLATLGFTLEGADGYCEPMSELTLMIDYRPIKGSESRKVFRIFHTDRYEEFDVCGSGAAASLHILEPKKNLKITHDQTGFLDIGIHPVRTLYVHYFELVNDGPFPVDFLVEPISAAEYDVFPRRGYVEPGFSVQIQLYFEPTSESQFVTILRVIWEGKSIKTKIVGTGGVGNLEVAFSDDNDALSKSLDFGMVPFHSACDKKFFLVNKGMVGVYTNAFIENEDYSLTLFGDIFSLTEIQHIKHATKGLAFRWDREVGVYLPPGMGVEVGVRYIARSATVSIGDVTIKSDAGSHLIPLKGKGGTLTLGHKGDLAFGDISCNFTYTRKIVITNGGSIPATLSSGWLVVGHSSEQALPTVQLSETFSNLDPRSQWARLYFCDSKKLPITSQLKPIDYWKLIAIMVKRNAVDMGMAQKVVDLKDRSIQRSSRKIQGMAAASTIEGRKAQAMPSVNAYFKRRQMFFHLITSTQLTSQSSTKVRPHIKVSPAVTQIPSYGETTLTVDLHLANEDTFLATLVVKADIPNTPQYEISLAATPKLVNIYCDDTRMLNFYRQPIGETELLSRSFTNIGHKDTPYKFINPNPGLSIVPTKGVLKVGQTIEVTFAFKPTDENIQNQNVIFEPFCSQPIRFKMFGGGGYAKASLARYRRFDFGHCMIGKDTASFLPITNDGNAILHLTKFEIQDTDTFFRGQDWPKSRISLFPGKTYQLPLVFNPHEENPMPGRLVIGTNSENYEIELIGFGREAVLIVSKVALEFSECIIGNAYEQKFSLKNIGDVNYPVTFALEKDFADVEFKPNSLVISPFSENQVTVTYRPTTETKTTVVLTISSPYSQHKVPLLLHAGYCILDFDSKVLDFGMFEKTTSPTQSMFIRNLGTVRTNFTVKDVSKPSIFQINPPKGLLLPGKTVEVKVTHVQHEVAQFEEKLVVKTDLVDRNYIIQVKGRCEETVLHPEEFCLMNIGVCPVLETTTKPLTFVNHGMFPLTYNIKSTYPLKVHPSQGSVEGKQTGVLNVSWNPSGGYELRTQLTMETNIGSYSVVIRGKSMFPELQLSTTYLDFGVCGCGFTYPQTVEIENRGKVPLRFSIPPCKDPSFMTDVVSGTLAPKETTKIQVLFTPTQLAKASSSILIECKGIHYKEIIVVGVGGQVNLDPHPKAIMLGRCPYDLLLPQLLELRNNGDVTTMIDFSETELNQRNCTLQVPEPFMIPPNRATKCQVGFKATSAGQFSCKLKFSTKEQTFVIPVSGVGIKINLSKRSHEILTTEILPLLKLDPLAQETDVDSLNLAIKTFRSSFMTDIDIVNTMASMYVKKEEYEPPQTILSRFGTRRRSSFAPVLVEHGLQELEAFKRIAELEQRDQSKLEELEEEPEEQQQPQIVIQDEPDIQLHPSELEFNRRTLFQTKKEILQKLQDLKQDPEPEFVKVKRQALRFAKLKEMDVGPQIINTNEDQVVQSIIDFGTLQLHSVDMTPILVDVEPEIDVDLTPILERPPPILSQKTKNLIKITDSKIYSQNFLPLDRRSRNARADPFAQ